MKLFIVLFLLFLLFVLSRSAKQSRNRVLEKRLKILRRLQRKDDESD
ncbi:hypothetical protein J7K93_14170 [bacterium]|nr:hypothetical protein [bacterium]